MPNTNITITDRVSGASFTVTDSGITISGNYRIGVTDNAIKEFSFSGSLEQADGFSGNISTDGRFSLYNVPLEKAATVVELVNEVYEQAVATPEEPSAQ